MPLLSMSFEKKDKFGKTLKQYSSLKNVIKKSNINILSLKIQQTKYFKLKLIMKIFQITFIFLVAALAHCNPGVNIRINEAGMDFSEFFYSLLQFKPISDYGSFLSKI